MPVFLLSEELRFPPTRLASESGLLAVGGDLSPERLKLAYGRGIFPWYSEGEPILWWSPDPRLILLPGEIRISRSLQRILHKAEFRVTMDRAFEQVIQACARSRLQGGESTWIVDDMIDAYCRLHKDGWAHSVEAWQGEELAGGLYGVSLGGCFFGESMFTRVSNASKVALVHLARQLSAWSFTLIDCQVTTGHLMRFGAREVPRTEFMDLLGRAVGLPTRRGKWEFEPAGQTEPRRPENRPQRHKDHKEGPLKNGARDQMLTNERPTRQRRASTCPPPADRTSNSEHRKHRIKL